jgi:cbb3-type cytochrome oxidase maturation FixS-like protein
MRRRLAVTAVTLAVVLVAPTVALAHDQPEDQSSRWIMADWMLETFFLFAGIALVGFLIAWKAGHFHDLEKAARIPLMIEEEDYYSPEWAFDEEEWDDVHAER